MPLPNIFNARWIADSLNGTLGHDDPVSSVTDSLNSIAASNTGTNRPTLKKNVFNGHSVIEHVSASAQFLQAGDNDLLDFTDKNLTVYFIGKKVAGNVCFVGKGDDPYPNGRYAAMIYDVGLYGGLYQNGIGEANANIGTFAEYDDADSTFHIYEFRFLPTLNKMQLWVDGVLVNTRTLGTHDNSNLNVTMAFNIGKYVDVLPLYYGGQWLEVGVARHTGDISTSDHAKIIEFYKNAYFKEHIFLQCDSHMDGQQFDSGPTQTGTAANSIPNRVAIRYGNAGSWKGTGSGSVLPLNTWLIAENGIRNVFNDAVGGRTITTFRSAFATEVTAKKSTTGLNKLGLMGGGNDFGGGATVAQVVERYGLVAADCAAEDIEFFPMTMLKITTGLNNAGFVAEVNPKIDLVNAELVADYDAEHLIRLDCHLGLQDPAVFTHEPGIDGVHANDTAFDIIDGEIYAFLTRTYVRPIITTASLPDAVMGAAYEQVIAATGSPDSWDFVSGTLPAGMLFNEAANKFEGTPTESGTFPNLVVRSINTTTQRFDTKTYSLTVAGNANTKGVRLKNIANSDGAITSYVIRRATNVGMSAGLVTFDALASVDEFEDDDDSKVSGTTYYYQIFGYNASLVKIAESAVSSIPFTN